MSRSVFGQIPLATPRSKRVVHLRKSRSPNFEVVWVREGRRVDQRVLNEEHKQVVPTSLSLSLIYLVDHCAIAGHSAVLVVLPSQATLRGIRFPPFELRPKWMDIRSSVFSYRCSASKSSTRSSN